MFDYSHERRICAYREFVVSQWTATQGTNTLGCRPVDAVRGALLRSPDILVPPLICTYLRQVSGGDTNESIHFSYAFHGDALLSGVIQTTCAQIRLDWLSFIFHLSSFETASNHVQGQRARTFY